MMSASGNENVLYTAKAHIIGGREGSARTSDGRLDVKITDPGAKGTGTNPEQLFAVGWSACYLSAIKQVGAQSKVRIPQDASIDTEVDLLRENGQYSIQVRLNVNLPGIDRETAQRIAETAHTVCPYSKATHGNINVVTNIVDSGAASSVA
jgi:Ohr subfamily peroxiredoxin